MNQKKMHAVHECRDAAEFTAFLDATEFSVQNILQEVVTESADATVIVVGSIPKGFGRPESDVDLLVLVKRDEQIRKEGKSIVFRNGSDGRFLSHKFFVDGVEIGVDTCSVEALSSLRTSVELLVSALSQPQRMGALPVLPYEDIRFLDAVRNGWVIHNPALADTVRERLKTDLLPLYCASYYYIQHLEALEDCYSLRGDEAEVFATNARICAHRATLSLLANHGITDPNERWTWKYLHRFFGERGTEPRERMWQLLSDLTFIAPQHDINERLVTLSKLRELGVEAERVLQAHPKLSGIVTALRSRLAYVFDDETLRATLALAAP